MPPVEHLLQLHVVYHNQDESMSFATSAHRNDDWDCSHRVAESFCKNFYCCGIRLSSFHDLLEHYESQHVVFDDDDTHVHAHRKCMDNAGDAGDSAFDVTIVRATTRARLSLNSPDSDNSNDDVNGKAYPSPFGIEFTDGFERATSIDPAYLSSMSDEDADDSMRKTIAFGGKIGKRKGTFKRLHQCLVPSCGKIYKNANGVALQAMINLL